VVGILFDQTSELPVKYYLQKCQRSNVAVCLERCGCADKTVIPQQHVPYLSVSDVVFLTKGAPTTAVPFFKMLRRTSAALSITKP